ncbi:MAG: hypothetical protein GYA58_00210 [Anaerolineaceae bacterium]|nr:hypothetical protein [Anaerolineaceae bacterium]
MDQARTLTGSSSFISISRFDRGEANQIFAELGDSSSIKVFENGECVDELVVPQRYAAMIEMLEEYALWLEAEKRYQSAQAGNWLTEEQLLADLGVSPLEF